MRSTGPMVRNTQENVLIESILAEMENCQSAVHVAETSLHALNGVSEVLQTTDKFLEDTAEIFNYRPSKHPQPGKQLFTYQTDQHETRLLALDLNTCNVPALYRCPVSLDVIDNPVVLNSLYFEYNYIEGLQTDPVNRKKIAKQDKSISKPVKNIISTFVRFHETQFYLTTRETERRAYLETQPDSKEKQLLLMPEHEFLQACGITPDQIPERYLTPVISYDGTVVEKRIYTFPVIIETSNQNQQGMHEARDKITICFTELMKYQTHTNAKDHEHKSKMLSIEKRRRKNDLRQEKEFNLLRSYIKHENDEISADLYTFMCEIEHKIKCDTQIKSLTYEDINPEIPEIINPFTGKPLESMEIDYDLLHELDAFLVNCYFEKLHAQRDRQLALVNQLPKHHRPLRVNELEEDIHMMRDQLSTEKQKLDFALQQQALSTLKQSVADYDYKAAHGDLKYFILNGKNMKYRFPGKSYADVLREKEIALPDDLPLGLVPNAKGNAYKYEVMTHPVILDDQYVIDYDTLQQYWRARPALFGIFGGREDLTGINPFTEKLIKSMRYETKLKAETDQFMMKNGFFEPAEKIVVYSKKTTFGTTLFNKKAHGLSSLASLPTDELQDLIRMRRD